MKKREALILAQSPDNDSPSSVFAFYEITVKIDDSLSLSFRTDTNAAHADVFISDRLFQKDRELVILAVLLPSLSLGNHRSF